MYIMANTGNFRGVRALPQRARPFHISLARRQGMLSRRKSRHFLPAGKNFTKWALLFLPVGKPGLQASDFQLPERTLTPAGAA
jgi:hypothetical protein